MIELAVKLVPSYVANQRKSYRWKNKRVGDTLKNDFMPQYNVGAKKPERKDVKQLMQIRK